MKLLITGGSGYIGSQLVKHFIINNDIVSTIIRKDSSLHYIEEFTDQVICYEHDGTTDNMIEILSSANPDIVLHLASMTRFNHSLIETELLIKDNILFGTQVLEAMAKNNISNFINTGSYWQNSNGKNYSPNSLYAATKEAYEKIIQYYVQVKNIRAITLILYDVYGPNDVRNKIFFQINQAVKKGETLSMTPGEQYLDMLFITDLIAAYNISIQRLMNNSSTNDYEKYYLTTGNQIKLKNLVELYLEISNKKINIDWGGKMYSDKQIMKPFSNGDKLPGWVAKTSLNEGLAQL